MKQKLWTRRIIHFFILTFLLMMLVACNNKNNRFELLSLQGQAGLFSDERVQVSFGNKDLELYQTVYEDIKISFDVMDLDQGHANQMIINDMSVIPIQFNGYVTQFTKVTYEILGLNVKDGQLKLTFQTGENDFGHLDTFHIRNVNLQIGDEILWSDEFPEEDYLNETIKIGSNDLESNYRFGYRETKAFTFTVNDELMNGYGTLFDEIKPKYDVVKNGEPIVLNNPYAITVSHAIPNETVIEVPFNLNLEVENADDVLILLDGIEVSHDLSFDPTAWAPGEHRLVVLAKNDQGFVKTFEHTFVLANVSGSFTSGSDVSVYDLGIIKDGSDHKKEVIWDQSTPISSAFGETSGIAFQSTYDASSPYVLYEGSTLTNRTAYLQIFNYESFSWDTVSTHHAVDQSVFTLGYNFKDNSTSYVKYGVIDWRVLTKNTSTTKDISSYLYHFTDIQYMTQKLYQADGTVLGDEAEEAYLKIRNYFIDSYTNNQVIYTMMTGDFTQTLRNTHQEYQKVMEHLFNPLFEANFPFGVLAGNHDIGALSENQNGGNTAFDENLTYDIFGTYLGPDKFSSYPFFGGATENNKSHYDRLMLGDTMYTFIYMGWGSSFLGVSVSAVDIQYAQSVINQFPDDPVVLLTHNYMGNSGQRTSTGESVYASLVLPNPQVKLVFSGHVNGSSARTDYIDMDLDGLYDREVFQMLTNFQEDENLYGASFIRRIGLDLTNHQLHFDLYSPFFNDYDIFVSSKKDIIGKHKAFTYDYDITQSQSGLITYRVMSS